MAARGQPAVLKPLSEEMSDTLAAMENTVRPENALLLRELLAKTTRIVEQQDQLSAAGK